MRTLLIIKKKSKNLTVKSYHKILEIQHFNQIAITQQKEPNFKQNLRII